MKNEITGFFEKYKKPIVTTIVVIVVVVLVWGGYKMLSRLLKNKKNAADAESFTGTDVSAGLPVGDISAQIAMACRGPFGWKTDEDLSTELLEHQRLQQLEQLRRFDGLDVPQHIAVADRHAHGRAFEQ